MKKYVRTAIAVLGLVFIGMQAYALPITVSPSNTSWIIATGQDMTSHQNSTSAILTYIATNNLIGTATELYKKEGNGSESGSLMASYDTLWNNDLSGGTITYISGNYLGNPKFMLVKDGNNTPWWYLFNLTAAGWNGTDTLILTGFWPSNGSISHVSLFGTVATQVSEPLSLLLLGAGLLGITAIRRKR